MRKKPLRQEKKQVFDAEAMVGDAAQWASALENRAYQGAGDTREAARYRAEQKYGVPAYTFWALRYRRPKDMLVSVYFRLKAAYEAECERQEARLRHELEITKATLGKEAADSPAVAQAEAFLGKADRKKAG